MLLLSPKKQQVLFKQNLLRVIYTHIKNNISMNTPENKPENDPQQTNDDGLDLTTPNDNQELDKVNDAVQAAEPSFTLNYDTKKPDEPKEDTNIK